MTMKDCGSGTTIHSCLDLLGFSSAWRGPGGRQLLPATAAPGGGDSGTGRGSSNISARAIESLWHSLNGTLGRFISAAVPSGALIRFPQLQRWFRAGGRHRRPSAGRLQ